MRKKKKICPKVRELIIQFFKRRCLSSEVPHEIYDKISDHIYDQKKTKIRNFWGKRKRRRVIIKGCRKCRNYYRNALSECYTKKHYKKDREFLEKYKDGLPKDLFDRYDLALVRAGIYKANHE